MPTGVNVAPVGKLVAPTRDMKMPVSILYAPIKRDLTPHGDHADADGHGDHSHAPAPAPAHQHDDGH